MEGIAGAAAIFWNTTILTCRAQLNGFCISAISIGPDHFQIKCTPFSMPVNIIHAAALGVSEPYMVPPSCFVLILFFFSVSSPSIAAAAAQRLLAPPTDTLTRSTYQQVIGFSRRNYMQWFGSQVSLSQVLECGVLLNSIPKVGIAVLKLLSSPMKLWRGSAMRSLVEALRLNPTILPPAVGCDTVFTPVDIHEPFGHRKYPGYWTWQLTMIAPTFAREL